MGQIQQPLLMLQRMVNINWSCAVVIFFWMKCVDRYFCNWLYSYTFIGVLGRGRLFIYFWFIGWRISVTLSVLLAACTEVWFWEVLKTQEHWNILEHYPFTTWVFTSKEWQGLFLCAAPPVCPWSLCRTGGWGFLYERLKLPRCRAGWVPHRQSRSDGRW